MMLQTNTDYESISFKSFETIFKTFPKFKVYNELIATLLNFE